MKSSDAIDLVRAAIPRSGGTWVDLGAGTGTFTQALVALLGPTARIYSVDHDPHAVASIKRWAEKEAPGVIPVLGDFRQPLVLPWLGGDALDGVLLANSLHFVRDAEEVLAKIAARLRPGGRVVIVEYDRQRASQWVPFPIPPERLPRLAAQAGISEPVITATKRSSFGGRLYVAAAERPREPAAILA